MNVLYEESGDFKVAAIMSETESTLQIEALTGKRSKIKASHVLMRFEGGLTGFMEAAQAEAEQLDTDFLWECCDEKEFHFLSLAKEYFGGQPTPQQSAGLALKLHSAPIYFHRKGKGEYRAASADILKAALAGLERKRQQAEWVANMVSSLLSKQLPSSFQSKLDMLFYSPDKNTLEWKALEQAAQELKILPLKVLAAAGAIDSVHDYHLGAFLREYFTAGTDYPVFEPLSAWPELPVSDTEAFSIDDATTTEIDDALSLKVLEHGGYRIGIHIAAPAIAIQPDSKLDQEIMRRLSTIYMPGHKITMLPEEIIRPFSLDAGEVKPALSLYLHVTSEWEVLARETRLEYIRIIENLRHDTLEPYFNSQTLEEDTGHPFWHALSVLFRFAEHLEKSRGKYDPNRPPPVDYNFYVTDGKVQIIDRERGSPMDKLVAELMIEANSYWGKWLADHGVPGIYRAQGSGKVYMTTQAEKHQGLGVAQYAWCTSPLRRAVDLINQRQLVALALDEDPPYPFGNEAIERHMRQFDLTYNAYSEFQTRMERFWCLQYIIQENIQSIEAVVWRENLVRLNGLPYTTKVPSLPNLTPGTRVTLQVQEVDTLLLELHCRYVETKTAPLEHLDDEEMC